MNNKPNNQAEHDRAEIKINLAQNGFLLKTKAGWFVYENPVALLEAVEIEVRQAMIDRGIKLK